MHTDQLQGMTTFFSPQGFPSHPAIRNVFYKVIDFLNTFSNLSLSPPIADLAARLRRKFRWALPDTFQAAVANHHGLELVTRNTKDFDPSLFDFVTVPYSL